MILFFSATGNSRHVANRIAEGTNDRMVSITDRYQSQDFSFTLLEGESLGIISPTYHWGLPSIVDFFMRNLKINNEELPYVYYVTTYGTTTGQSDTFMKKHLERLGIQLNASFSVKMPDSWTPLFDLSNTEKLKKINDRAEPKIDEIIEQVKSRTHGNYMKDKVPMLASKLYHLTYEVDRQTKYFTVEKSCIGCGICAKNCPENAMMIQSGYPVWIKSKCVMCLGCLHRCPKFSIQYKKKTKTHGQYLHP